jgi:hypothetical protein
MIINKSKPITLLIILVFSFGVSAQSINLNYADGTNGSYNLEDVRKITFDKDIMNLQLRDGSIYKWNVSSIGKYQYNKGSLNVKELLERINSWEVNIYPNPTSNEFNLSFNLPKEDEITISLYDIKGNLLKNIQLGKQPIGENKEVLDLSSLPSGTFLCRIIGQNNVITKKFIKH